MPSFISLYDILEISYNASAEEIKTSFRKLAKIYHPDKNRQSDKSEIEFITIHNAYETLIDSGKREEYNHYLKTKINISIDNDLTHSENKIKSESDRYAFSIEQINSSIHFIILDIETFLNTEYKTCFNKEINGISIRKYILQILVFIDKWILFPSGYHEEFITSGRKDGIDFSDYADIIESEDTASGYEPFFSMINYFYNIKKRIDEFLENVKVMDLYKKNQNLNIYLIDSIIETEKYTKHYLSNLNLFNEGKINEIKPFKYSNSCFK